MATAQIVGCRHFLWYGSQATKESVSTSIPTGVTGANEHCVVP